MKKDFTKILTEKYNELTEELKNARRHSEREDIKTQLLLIEKALDEIKVDQFLYTYTPDKIAEELNKRVVGQPELTEEVASFLHYHMLRMLHPELPPRPMLIAGPSGSGKTEVWRVAEELFGELFQLHIADGSRFTTEGFKGNYKVSTIINDHAMTNGGVLVVDEFDKLVKPRHTSSGDNVSLELQAEFLKLIEGEYTFLDDDDKETNINSKKMGFVFVGAFDELAEKKKKRAATRKIGFDSLDSQNTQAAEYFEFTEEDYLDYGMMPELVGRIASKCNTRHLSDDDYVAIIKNEHSRFSKIAKVLQGYGVDISDLVSDDEIKELIKRSKENRTGVRWVSAQIENVAMDYLRTCDIRNLMYAKAEKRFNVVEGLLKEAEERAEKEPGRRTRRGEATPASPYQQTKSQTPVTAAKCDDKSPSVDGHFEAENKDGAESSILDTYDRDLLEELFDKYDCYDEFEYEINDIVDEEHRAKVSANTAKRLMAIFNFYGIGKETKLCYTLDEGLPQASITIEEFCTMWAKTDTFGAMSIPLLKSFEDGETLKTFSQEHAKTLLATLSSDNFQPFDYDPDLHIEGPAMVGDLYWDETREKYD